ncbi:MAG: hypothetical protein U5K28_02820 [Halobacteriales archaeon]|nr:hypothetical protein [Halobacteriales archaeon]
MRTATQESITTMSDGGELYIERVPSHEAGGDPEQFAHDVTHVPSGITTRYLAPTELEEDELGDMYESVLHGAFINDNPDLFE